MGTYLSPFYGISSPKSSISNEFWLKNMPDRLERACLDGDKAPLFHLFPPLTELKSFVQILSSSKTQYSIRDSSKYTTLDVRHSSRDSSSSSSSHLISQRDWSQAIVAFWGAGEKGTNFSPRVWCLQRWSPGRFKDEADDDEVDVKSWCKTVIFQPSNLFL